MVSAHVCLSAVNHWCLVGEQRVQEVLSGETLQASCHFRPQVLWGLQVIINGKQTNLLFFHFVLRVTPQFKAPSSVRLFPCSSNNNQGGVLVHFWMAFVVPRLKSSVMCEECIAAIFRDSIDTSLKNRSSVGYLLGLPVDIDSILINGVFVCLSCVYLKAHLSVLLKI